MIPVGDVVRVTDAIGHRQFARRSWFFLQLQSHLFRQAIPFQTIDPLVGKHTIFPARLASSRPWDNMIDVSLVRGQLLPGVLALSSVPLPDPFGRKLRPPFWHLVVPGKNQYRRYADQSPNRSHGVVFRPNIQFEPFHPTHWAHISRRDYVQSGCITVCHHTESLRRRFHVDRLPASVQNQNRRFMQDVVHDIRVKRRATSRMLCQARRLDAVKSNALKVSTCLARHFLPSK
jgi:hypothetical protein